MRGGVSYITKRYSKANNKYIKSYDPYKPSTYITYLDTNNLHGWTMGQYIPYGRFKWSSQKEIDKSEVNSIAENSLIGYILEVDLKYPDELHELYNDYPLATEKHEISDNMLSKYCSNIADKYEIKIGGVNKLIPSIGNKSKYIVH